MKLALLLQPRVTSPLQQSSYTAMKTLIICLLLSTLSLTFAVPAFDFDSLQKYLPSSFSPNKQDKDEVSALLQTLVSAKDDQDSEDDEDDGTVADLQGIFNVMAQIELEKATQQHNKNVAMAQFWGGIGRALWNAGKGYLKRKYCTEEEEMRVMLQELVGEQGVQDEQDDGNDDIKARAELQTLFNALKKVDAKVMQDDSFDDTVKAEGWWKRARRWARKKIRGATRRYLC